MKLTPVQSSHIAARGYDPATGRLRIQFRGGKIYETDNVSPEAWEAFLNAESAGRHWHSNLRNHPDYEFKLVEVDDGGQ